MFEFDEGSSGGGGPFVEWKAKGSEDRIVPPGSFQISGNDVEKRHMIEMDNGVIFDIRNTKTGWGYWEDRTKVVQWNPSISRVAPKPQDPRFRKCFEVPLAIGNGETATWGQIAAGAWGGFAALFATFKNIPEAMDPNLLPVVRLSGSKPVTFGEGSTAEPILEVIQWVAAPDCLKPEAASFDPGPATEAVATAPPPAAAPAPAPQGATVF